jgi:Uma2 family endonuclease
MNEIPRTRDLTGIDRSMASLTGRRWTTAELLDRIEAGLLDPDEEFELIHGEVVPMSAEGRFHLNLRNDLTDFLTRRRSKSVRVDGEPHFNLTDDTFRKPDILLRSAAMSGYDVRGPDALLVIEISDSSLASDLRPKAAFYAGFGVREYWVIAARSRVTWVHCEPSATGYIDVREVAPDQPLVPLLVPGLTFRLDDVGMQDD